MGSRLRITGVAIFRLRPTGRPVERQVNFTGARQCAMTVASSLIKLNRLTDAPKAQRHGNVVCKLVFALSSVAGRRFLPLSFAPVRLCVILFVLFAGCSSKDATSDASSAKRHTGVKLRLVVADDPAIAAAAMRLKDEWNAQTGAEVEVTECKEKDLIDAATLPGDAVICPAIRLLATPARSEGGSRLPVPHSIAAGIT